MGVNLFVEGNPMPVAISIRLPKSVDSIEELDKLVGGLKAINSILSKEWPKLWSGYYEPHRQRREVYLLSFSVKSPPEFLVFVDPAWLAVFVTILAGYEDIKRNTGVIYKDVQKIFGAIKGLTERELELLEIAVRMSLGKVAELGEQKSMLVAKKFGKVRDALLGEANEPPEIKVINIDKDRFW